MLVRCTLDQTIERVEACFAHEGYRALRSFDLQLARASMLDQGACACPHHGTGRCTCQYVVYLVYSEQPEPTTVVVHGHDDRSQIKVERGGSAWAHDLHARLEHFLTKLEPLPVAGDGSSTRED